VLQTLLDNHLKAKGSKCSFGVQSVEYLGHLISTQGVTTDPQKIKTMQNWPVPTTLRVLRGFLGLTSYYRKFIHNYGAISKPLTDLLQKNAFKWTLEAGTAFQQLKHAMCTASVLALPDFSKSFTLETDACGTIIGAVLMQEGRPSKALGMKNQLLSTYEKEYLVLLTAVQKWRHYLQDTPSVIKTDHLSLKHLLEQRLTHSLQHKGLSKLLGLEYIIQYKKGIDNKAVDALSRQIQDNSAGVNMAITKVIPTWIEELKESYVGDSWAEEVLSKIASIMSANHSIRVHCGVIRKGNKLYVGSTHQWRERLITIMHDSSFGGHSRNLGNISKSQETFLLARF
jgi:RNase H-like domain found in reverse transcriptase